MRTTLLAAAVSLLSIFAQAGAEELRSFEPAKLVEVAEDMGWQARIQEGESGSFVRVETREGVVIALTPTACSPYCTGLVTTAVWGKEWTDEALQRFELAHNFIAVKTTDDLVYLSRYDIADHGMKSENLKVILGVFNLISRQLVNFEG